MGAATSSRLSPIAPCLAILHGNRLERLCDAAILWGREHPLAPLENEVFLVQSNGMAQWLKLAFADAYGICAAHRFLMPSRFLWEAYRQVLGADTVPATSPFDESRLVWRLFRWLSQTLPRFDEGSTEAALYAPLRRYLHDGRDAAKCFGLAQKLADLFDQYQVYRADWLNAWQSGLDILPEQGAMGGPSSGMTGIGCMAVPESQRWQPALWRALTGDVPTALQQSGRSHVHRRFIDALQQSRYPVKGLPRRLQVFGLSSLPTQTLEAIDALSRHIQVLVYVVNPCPYYWADIMDGRELLGITRHRHARRPGLPPMLPLEEMAARANPLLAAWGKQGRDFIGLLYRYDPDEVSHAKIDLFESPTQEHTTLLTQIQHAIHELQPLPATPEQRPVVATSDHSLQFHLCHSRQREVEVLHDRLLDLFEQQPDLQPRDVIVMAPDIDRYAAHVEAVFGNVAREDARYIPFTLADRPERACHPMAKAFETLLRLPELRMSVSDVLGLLEVGAVRERFGIAASDLPILQRWMAQSGIRWGLTAAQRHSLDLPADLHVNTWQFGLRRLLLGYASGRSDAWCGVEPFAAVAGLEGALAGKLLQAVEALEHTWHWMLSSHTVAEWGVQLQAMLKQFFVPQEDTDPLLLRRFDNAIVDWQRACEEGGLCDTALSVEMSSGAGGEGNRSDNVSKSVTTEMLPLVVVREALMVALDREGLSQRFLAGCVNFCTLMPMRSIPFKVVCLLGMNDGEYPRHRSPVDFDLMNGRYRPGDRSRREDDRYLFLEALLSARALFYISYIGRSIRDDSERPPSVLVAQLRDYVASAFCLENGEDIVQTLTWVHPLQPFSLQYFTGHERWFTYASEWREIHQKPVASSAAAPLPPYIREAPLTLDELYRFLRQPAVYFFAQRLKVRFPRDEEMDLDCETFALDGLARSKLGQDLIQCRHLQQKSFAETVERWRREGRLPAGQWGELAVASVVSDAEQVWEALQACLGRYSGIEPPLEIQWPDRAALAEAPVLQDWVSGMVRGPEGVALLEWRATASRGKGSVGIKYHYLLSAWVKQVCLAAQGARVQSIFVAPDHVYVFPVLSQAQAHEQLQQWIQAWQHNMAEPLPVAFKAALAFLRTAHAAKVDPWDNAEKIYVANSEFASAERDESPALLRTYTSVSDMKDFDVWAQRLYGDFFHWVDAGAAHG